MLLQALSLPNRSWIPRHLQAQQNLFLNINAIKDVIVYSNSRLRIVPLQGFDKEIIVSREKVTEFKDWFGGGGNS